MLRPLILCVSLCLPATVSLAGEEAAGAAAAGEALTPASALETLLAAADQNEDFDADWLTLVERLFTDAQNTGPKDGRWPMGLALVARERGEGKDARKLAEKAVNLSPNEAKYHYLLGNMVFETIADAGLLEKGSLASKGRKAYERAVELDPSLIGARVGLGMFYFGAPSIAGGSKTKAREQADALLAMGGEGAHQGHMLLGRIAATEKEWDEMQRQFEAAAGAATSPADASQAIASLAAGLMREKKDIPAALPVIERMKQSAAPDDPLPDYMLGEAKQRQKDHAAAVLAFEAALALRPNSGTIRFALAESLEALERWEDALTNYEYIVEHSPKHRSADDAKSGVKRMKKKLKRK